MGRGPLVDEQPEHFETIVVGGGQAGLAVGYHLARQGLGFVILDAGSRVGDAWRSRWAGLRLFTSARYDGLPGMPFPGPRDALPTKDEVADFLEAYAARMELPIRGGTRVSAIWPADGRGFLLAAGRHHYRAANVVVATGAYSHPRVPDFASDLDPSILQLHSSEYRSPAQLADGGVLVVGASNSGAEIALGVAGSHQTLLSGPDKGKMPVRPESALARVFDPAFWLFLNRVATLSNPFGRKALPFVRDHGGPLERVWPADLEAAGVERVFARAVAVRDGLPVLEDGRVVDVANVIWCTGFRPRFDWIHLPIIGDDGWPMQSRGVVPGAPGLFFVGLPFLHSAASALLGGVGRDAAHIAEQLRRRQRTTDARPGVIREFEPGPARRRTPSPPPVMTDQAS
jgi:putative flavoprotein involved in K+ transport